MSRYIGSNCPSFKIALVSKYLKGVMNLVDSNVLVRSMTIEKMYETNTIPADIDTEPFGLFNIAATAVETNKKISCTINILPINNKISDVTDCPSLNAETTRIDVVSVTKFKIAIFKIDASILNETTLRLEIGFANRNSAVLSRSSFEIIVAPNIAA